MYATGVRECALQATERPDGVRVVAECANLEHSSENKDHDGKSPELRRSPDRGWWLPVSVHRWTQSSCCRRDEFLSPAERAASWPASRPEARQLRPGKPSRHRQWTTDRLSTA